MWVTVRQSELSCRMSLKLGSQSVEDKILIYENEKALHAHAFSFWVVSN